MKRIFQKRLKDFIGRIDQTIRSKPIEGANTTQELMGLLHSKKSNLILLPSSELTNLIDAPCAGSFTLFSKEHDIEGQQGDH